MRWDYFWGTQGPSKGRRCSCSTGLFGALLRCKAPLGSPRGPWRDRRRLSRATVRRQTCDAVVQCRGDAATVDDAGSIAWCPVLACVCRNNHHHSSREMDRSTVQTPGNNQLALSISSESNQRLPASKGDRQSLPSSPKLCSTVAVRSAMQCSVYYRPSVPHKPAASPIRSQSQST